MNESNTLKSSRRDCSSKKPNVDKSSTVFRQRSQEPRDRSAISNNVAHLDKRLGKATEVHDTIQEQRGISLQRAQFSLIDLPPPSTLSVTRDNILDSKTYMNAGTVIIRQWLQEWYKAEIDTSIPTWEEPTPEDELQQARGSPSVYSWHWNSPSESETCSLDDIEVRRPQQDRFLSRPGTKSMILMSLAQIQGSTIPKWSIILNALGKDQIALPSPLCHHSRPRNRKQFLFMPEEKLFLAIDKYCIIDNEVTTLAITKRQHALRNALNNRAIESSTLAKEDIADAKIGEEAYSEYPGGPYFTFETWKYSSGRQKSWKRTKFAKLIGHSRKGGRRQQLRWAIRCISVPKLAADFINTEYSRKWTVEMNKRRRLPGRLCAFDVSLDSQYDFDLMAPSEMGEPDTSKAYNSLCDIDEDGKYNLMLDGREMIDFQSRPRRLILNDNRLDMARTNHYETYVGAVIGGMFQLEHLEKVQYHFNLFSAASLQDLGMHLDARKFELIGLRGKALDARVKSMRRQQNKLSYLRTINEGGFHWIFNVASGRGSIQKPKEESSYFSKAHASLVFQDRLPMCHTSEFDAMFPRFGAISRPVCGNCKEDTVLPSIRAATYSSCQICAWKSMISSIKLVATMDKSDDERSDTLRQIQKRREACKNRRSRKRAKRIEEQQRDLVTAESALKSPRGGQTICNGNKANATYEVLSQD